MNNKEMKIINIIKQKESIKNEGIKKLLKSMQK